MGRTVAISADGIGGFERYAAQVYAWAYRVLGRHHDALDVVQDVFLRWHAQCQRRPPAKPHGWLREVTVNRAIDFRRRRPPTSVAAGVTRPHTAEPADEADSSERAVLRGELAGALAQLTEVQRVVLVAKVYEELTFTEIAGELDLAVSTVKTHYLRALRSLRDCLAARYGGSETH